VELLIGVAAGRGITAQPGEFGTLLPVGVGQRAIALRFAVGEQVEGCVELPALCEQASLCLDGLLANGRLLCQCRPGLLGFALAADLLQPEG